MILELPLWCTLMVERSSRLEMEEAPALRVLISFVSAQKKDSESVSLQGQHLSTNGFVARSSE